MGVVTGRPRFHLAIPVDDLATAAHFYGDILCCARGRSATTWIDWDLAGHQLVTHLVPAPGGRRGAADPPARATRSTATTSRCRTSVWC